MESATAAIAAAPAGAMARESLPIFAIEPGGIMDRRRIWYVFRIFNLYRLMLVGVLLGIFVLDEGNRFVGTVHPALFAWTVGVYIAIVLLSIAGSYRRRPSLQVQAHFQTLVDLVCLIVLIHASGGPSSSLNILLVTAVAASSILLSLYSTLLAAATALVLVVGERLYMAWTPFTASFGDGRISVERIAEFLSYAQPQGDELGRLGMLGASLLIAALLTHTLAERARRSEELVRKRTLELVEIADLNQTIVRHLQSGILVVDRFCRIRLMNEMACGLLNYHSPAQGVPLEEVSHVLGQRLATWLGTGLHNPKPFRQDEHLPDIAPSFIALKGGKGGSDTLIFLEDSTQVAQRLQQIKLAALGRLTASIAHEIRNPLASISHAAQLLSESPSASVGDRRLKQIIHENTKRASRIISDVMDLSRRDKAKPEDFALKPWLEEFGREFLRSHGEPPPQIEIRALPEDLAVRFDPGHLHQVLWNLCTNACVHGTPPGQTPRIRLAAEMNAVRSRPVLDVIDFGPGIPETEARKIFEPFFTTQPQGTGLGLYISREMCEANRAELQYLREPEGGSRFRITFANPSKQDVTARWNVARP